MLGLLWWQLQHQRGELQAPCCQWGGSPVGKLLPGTWDITKAPQLTNPLQLETVGNNPSSEDIKDVINQYSCYKFVRNPQMVSFDEPSDTWEYCGLWTYCGHTWNVLSDRFHELQIIPDPQAPEEFHFELPTMEFSAVCCGANPLGGRVEERSQTCCQ